MKKGNKKLPFYWVKIRPRLLYVNHNWSGICWVWQVDERKLRKSRFQKSGFWQDPDLAMRRLAQNLQNLNTRHQSIPLVRHMRAHGRKCLHPACRRGHPHDGQPARRSQIKKILRFLAFRTIFFASSVHFGFQIGSGRSENACNVSGYASGTAIGTKADEKR